jgi:hypothetical protein
MNQSVLTPTTTGGTFQQQVTGPGGLTPDQIWRIQQAAEARIGTKDWKQWLFEEQINRGTPLERAIAAAGGAEAERTVQEIINQAGISQTPITAGQGGTQVASQAPQQQAAAMAQYWGAAPGQAVPQGMTAQNYPAAQQIGQLPLPNQIAPQTWRNLAPSQQQLLLGAYEAQGWNKDDVQALLAQSLPRYASNAPSAGTWRLTG